MIHLLESKFCPSGSGVTNQLQLNDLSIHHKTEKQFAKKHCDKFQTFTTGAFSRIQDVFTAFFSAPYNPKI